ncbi:MAG: hypothetical protein GY765_02095 [bacterium]|nr:hypothetical protein [bacterium]
MNVQVKAKEIDFKSLLIGFLLATVVFLLMGAGYGDTQDVRIVGVSTYDELKVKVESISSSTTMPVKVERFDSSLELPVVITGTKYNETIPVHIAKQPVLVEVRN